jgi:hypothetical protein
VCIDLGRTFPRPGSEPDLITGCAGGNRTPLPSSQIDATEGRIDGAGVPVRETPAQPCDGGGVDATDWSWRSVGVNIIVDGRHRTHTF